MPQRNIGIIGAGIIGTAIARYLALSLKDGSKITVIEKEPGVCMGTSRFNSGVNHSGFHQNPGSLKAELAFRGNRLMQEYVEQNLPKKSYSNCGMLIAISRSELANNLIHDLPDLVHMIRRGRKQGISFKFVGPLAIKKIEPNISALGGIFIPQVSVIDSVAVCRSFYRDAISHGVKFYFNHSVSDIRLTKNAYIVRAGEDEFSFDCLINSAGLYADEISSMAGVAGYKIYPWRGEYFQIVGLPDDYIRTLVYPAVSKNSPGKGIHLRPLMDGKVLAGPSALLASSKKDYNNRLPKEVFLKAVNKFFPDIQEDNLIQSYAGIRPKLRVGGEEDDFVINVDREEPLLINLIGIESPGLSASMAIAEYVFGLMEKVW